MHRFPDNKQFAFTIFDDTDLSTVTNIRPVYDLLSDLGMRTTKSVWPLASVNEGRLGGSSLQDPDYLDFILELQDRGFEIALHNVRNHDSDRAVIQLGLNKFRELMGQYPRIHTNHSSNRDNLYWGSARLDYWHRLYQAFANLRQERPFEGHNPATPYFWGDLCQNTVDYVRSFVFDEINLDRVNPTLPYHDPTRPFVKHWFSSCDGADVNSFREMISLDNQERLEAQGGVCIMYTHFACGFVNRGAVDAATEELLRALARRNGWFVPVSCLLDHLRQEKSDCTIQAAELASMERRWAFQRLSQLAMKRIRVALPKSLELAEVHDAR